MEQRLEILQKLAFAARRKVADAFKAAGFVVTAEEWATLTILQNDPGLTPSKLATKARRDQTTVTRMIDRLDRKQLVERQRDPNDRRAQRLFLTRHGYETFAELHRIAERLEWQIFGDWPPDKLAHLDDALSSLDGKFNSLVEY